MGLVILHDVDSFTIVCLVNFAVLTCWMQASLIAFKKHNNKWVLLGGFFNSQPCLYVFSISFI